MLTATSTRTRTKAFLTAGWYNLAMLNFPINPSILEPYIPAGTQLDYWQDHAYVSVVGFQFIDAKVFGMPIPFHRHFAEVNLRFYVRRQAADGWRRGVVFVREIAPRVLVSLTARWFYNEKYVTMAMRQRIDLPAENKAGIIQYEWQHQQRWHGVSVRIHGQPQPLLAGSEEEFIAEHYWGYTKQPDGSTMEYQVEHPSWHVWPGSSAHLDCDVEAIYGEQFAPFLRRPSSAFVAAGSPIVVRRGQRLAAIS